MLTLHCMWLMDMMYTVTARTRKLLGTVGQRCILRSHYPRAGFDVSRL